MAKSETQKKLQQQHLLQQKGKRNSNTASIKQDPHAQLALLKEILFDDDRLKGLLNQGHGTKSRPDNTLKAVQNFFNDHDDLEDDNMSTITNGNRVSF